MTQLMTPRGEALKGTPWDIYPRPQMRRDNYVNLNGDWDFTVSPTLGLPEHYDRRILVPFSPESLLSGIGTHFPEGSWLYYRKQLFLPLRDGRVLLHVGAADQELICYVNSKEIGRHEGGYESMTFDITEALAEENTLVLACRDDLRRQDYPYGKQTLHRGGMWYTPVSGIWQSVWAEYVPDIYVEKLTVRSCGYGVTVSIRPALAGTVRIPQLGDFPLENGQVTVVPKTPHLWCPEDPYLYDFTLEAGEDRIESYFAIRALDIQTVGGIPRLCLNGKPYFFHGLLDQGYWPEGLLTPPAPQCYEDDILAMKALGFNTLRKHIQVEPEEFYYQCDRLGMVVFQDMVNNGDYAYFRDTVAPTLGIQKRKDHKLHRDPLGRKRFLAGMQATVRQLESHPCICCWTIFNEGWGQFEGAKAYELLLSLDSTRFIDTTSGWFRCCPSQVESLHIYFGSWGKLKAGSKPLILSEFGGYTYGAPGHLFDPEKSYGYRTFQELDSFRRALTALYRERILPAVPKGLCAAIYTQVSDVEEEINGLLTYDRKFQKADPLEMQALAAQLQEAIKAVAAQ